MSGDRQDINGQVTDQPVAHGRTLDRVAPALKQRLHLHLGYLEPSCAPWDSMPGATIPLRPLAHHPQTGHLPADEGHLRNQDRESTVRRSRRMASSNCGKGCRMLMRMYSPSSSIPS